MFDEIEQVVVCNMASMAATDPVEFDKLVFERRGYPPVDIKGDWCACSMRRGPTQ